MNNFKTNNLFSSTYKTYKIIAIAFEGDEWTSFIKIFTGYYSDDPDYYFIFDEEKLNNKRNDSSLVGIEPKVWSLHKDSYKSISITEIDMKGK